MALISGIVRDQDGTPVARTVRAYRRDTGALLAETNSAGGPPVPGDTHISQVVSLLHMDGSARDVKGVSWTAAGTASYVAGLFGRALSLSSGDSGLVEPSVSPSLDLPGDFTAECWIKPSGSASDQVILNRFNTDVGSSGWQITLSPNNKIYFYIYASGIGGSTLITSTSITLNAWHFVSVSRTSGNVKLFIDGVAVGSSTTSINFTSKTALFSIGFQAQGGGRYPFRGLIEEVRITNGVGRYSDNFLLPVSAFPDTSDDIAERAIGEYVMSVQYTGEVQVLCLDDAEGELQNDQVLRTFPV